ncbi:MAG: hypothetical protein AAFQ73_06925 [Pseudomonadota bacterium]
MDATQIPDELLQKALNDPQMRAMLEKMHEQTGNPTPFEDIPKEHQKAALAALATGLKQQADQQPTGQFTPEQIPDELATQIFGDPRAQEMLAKFMADSGLEGAPSDLDMHSKKTIVSALINSGAIHVGPPPGAQN